MPRRPTGRPPGRPRFPGPLTPGEQRVLEEVRLGLTNAEIGVRLGLSPDTVKTHVASMLSKLGLEDRRALAEWRGDELEPRRGRWPAGPREWRRFVAVGAPVGVALVVVAIIALLAGHVDDGQVTPPAAETPVTDAGTMLFPEGRWEEALLPYPADVTTPHLEYYFSVVAFVDPAGGLLQERRADRGW